MLCLFVGPVGLDNGVGLRPAMGYNTWNDLRCEGVTADAIDAIAVAMVELELAKLGYAYLNVDDCWATATDPSGELVADPAAFPDGLPALVESVHARGLRFGLYGDRGWKTCAFRPGSGGLEPAHAAQFARWGVDYLKYDSCWASNDHDAAFEQYGAMRDALNASGRPVLYSLCGWNAWYAPRGAELANSWRIAADCDEWANVYVAVRTNEALGQHAAPGGFNDPDMLLGSDPTAPAHLTPRQVQAQFSLWAVMAAPLLIGSRLRSMPASDLATYSNPEAIAINQDALIRQGEVVWSNCPPYAPRDNWWNSPWSMPREVAVAWTSVLVTAAMLSATSALLLRRRAPRTARLMLVFAACCTGYVGWIWCHRPRLDACQQVWARPLEDGSHALCFVNFAPHAAVVGCDSACMARAGIRSPVTVRDAVRQRATDFGQVRQVDAVHLPADGGSELYRLTPLSV